MVNSPPRDEPPIAVTIWLHYGPYHIARVAALEANGYHVIGFVCYRITQELPYFNARPDHYELINDRPPEQVRWLGSFRNTLGLLRRHHPQLVLTCGYERPETAAAFVYARLRRGGKRPVVLVMLDNQLDDRQRHRSVEFVKRQYLRWFDGFVVSGSKTLAYLEVLGLAGRPVGTGYDCVDNGWIASAARQARERGMRLAGAEDYFLCVSRMAEEKNLPFLISAYRRYRDSLPEGMRPWNLVLCGDGPARGEVEAAIVRNGLTGAVILAGFITDPVVLANYYAFANVGILPSAVEPWGLVVNEAMAASLPVLVSNRCGSAPDLVDEASNGFTFDPADEPRLASLMRWMQCNRDRLPEMGERSAEVVRKFSPRRFAESVARVEADAMRVREQRAHG